MILRPSSHLLHRQTLITAHGYQSCTRPAPINPSYTSTSSSASRRRFTASRYFQADSNPNHYHVLGVPTSATPADLKKRFYILSKESHPDLHPNDPSAVPKFQQISESYSILGSPEKRKKYDRDVMHIHPNRPSASGSGSGNGSNSYAGSRPPSGLSKRRSAFRGPPPSYYTHGGGGAHQANSNQQARSSTATSSEYTHHPGATSWTANANRDFNANPIFQTQQQEDSRRDARRAAAMAAAQREAEIDGDFWARFVIITTIVLGGVWVGTLFVNSRARNPSGRNVVGGSAKGDGSARRGGSS